MYKLYGRKESGSLAVEAALACAGADYAFIDVERRMDNDYPPDFLKLSPLGQVPVLILPGGVLMTESAAMVIQLADTFPVLAPDANDRPSFLRWMVFLAANVYMTDLRIYYSERYTIDPDGAEAVKAAAVARMAREFAIYADALGDGPCMVSGRLTALDIYAAMLATWDPDVPALFARHPNLKRMHDAVADYPAVAKVWKRHGL